MLVHLSINHVIQFLSSEATEPEVPRSSQGGLNPALEPSRMLFEQGLFQVPGKKICRLGSNVPLKQL